MTEDRLLIEELAAKGGQPDFLRTIAESGLQLIMEADVDGLIGAGVAPLLRALLLDGIIGGVGALVIWVSRRRARWPLPAPK